jgi:hypothetical protein
LNPLQSAACRFFGQGLPATAYASAHSWQTALALWARQLNKNIHAEGQ